MSRLGEMLAWLESARDRDAIKIVMGVRGCGKSHLLSAYSDHLLSLGVPRANILAFNFEHPARQRIHTPEDLLKYIDATIPPEGRVYLLMDEIFELRDFEVALGVLFGMKRLDIVATCSNTSPVTGRFRQYLDGKYLHREMLLPSFAEFSLQWRQSFRRRLSAYFRFGAMPYTFGLHSDLTRLHLYLEGLWNTILVKDILMRNRLADSRLTERLLGYVFCHLGESTSLRKVAAEATIEGHEAAPNTVETYLSACNESMLVRKIPKIDVFSGETLKMGYRFYMADLAIGGNRFGVSKVSSEMALRNLIFQELRGRHGPVYGGRCDNNDFDFVTRRGGKCRCWHYLHNLENGQLPRSLMKVLRTIPREMAKTVIVRTDCPLHPPDDVEIMTLEQFLLPPQKGKEHFGGGAQLIGSLKQEIGDYV